VGKNHPDTSQQAARKAEPKSGTKKKVIYDLIVASGMFGMCDHEIEKALDWTHQTASASRNTLMNDGWVIDSGHRRATDQGNDAIAWIAVL
jgi:predicted transcriptional regulator